MSKDGEVVNYIHIGKCGGSTVRKVLKKKKIEFKTFHVCSTIKYNPDNKYLIVIRNPIKRFISAFNWRHYLVTNNLRKEGQTNLYYNQMKNTYQKVLGTQKRSILPERRFFNKYNDIEQFCIDLKDNPYILEEYDLINHMNLDIHHYLKEIIDKCPKNQISGIITTDTMKDDLKHIYDYDLDYLNNTHKKNNDSNGYNKTLSDESYETLKNYLRKDYIIIDKMYKFGWITDEQYKILKL
jgi:hypothetical protein